MRAVLKILAVIYLVCVVFKTRPHYTFLGLEERERELALRQEQARSEAPKTKSRLAQKIKNLRL